MDDNLPDNTSIADDNAVADIGGSVQPPPSYAATPEQLPVSAPEQVETITPEVQETLAAPEIPVPTPEAPVEEKVVEEVPVAPAAPAEPATNVVDKRAPGVEQGTPLETTHKLTEEADEEEEDFIKHVEEVHSIN